MIYTSHYESALGGITLAGNEMALIGLWFDGQKHFGATLPEEYKEKDLPIFEQTVHWMDLYFSGEWPGIFTAYRSADDSLPQSGLGDTADDPLRTDYDLWRNRRTDRSEKRRFTHVCSGCRRCGGT